MLMLRPFDARLSVRIGDVEIAASNSRRNVIVAFIGTLLQTAEVFLSFVESFLGKPENSSGNLLFELTRRVRWQRPSKNWVMFNIHTLHEVLDWDITQPHRPCRPSLL
jgi:hypothetical protein